MVDVPIVGDAGAALEHPKLWKARQKRLDQKALARVVAADRRVARPEMPCATARAADIIKPQYAIQRLYELTKGKDVYITTEVGQHQMWAAQFFRFEEPNRWMTSGGLGTMGYGLPAAMGVQVAHPEAW